MPFHRGAAGEHKLISPITSSGDSSQMLRKNQTRNESQEESRLLPGARFQQYVGEFIPSCWKFPDEKIYSYMILCLFSDKNAVKIRPGETKRKSAPGVCLHVLDIHLGLGSNISFLRTQLHSSLQTVFFGIHEKVDQFEHKEEARWHQVSG